MNKERSYSFMSYLTLFAMCVMYLICQTVIWFETNGENFFEMVLKFLLT